jgi:hypothetical protein
MFQKEPLLKRTAIIDSAGVARVDNPFAPHNPIVVSFIVFPGWGGCW